MRIHTYREEDFGCLVAFRDGRFRLYTADAFPLCAADADSDALTPHELQHLTISPDFHLRAPLIVWIEVTRGCNLRCRHCFVSAAEQQPDEFTTAQLLSFLDELKAMNVFCVVFSGGEPFLRPDFLQILEHASRLGLVISVVTNGFLLSDALIARLPTTNLRITVSLDNLHFGETHELETNRSFAYLQSRLLSLKAAGVATHVSATMTRTNLTLLETIFTWLREHEILFRTIPFTPIGRGALYPELQLQPSDTKQAAALWATEVLNEHALQGTQGLTFSQCFDYALTLVYLGKACKGGRYIAYVSANGDVFPCTTCAGCDIFAAGNVTTSAFHEIWNTAFRPFRRLTRWENFAECQGCGLSRDPYFCTNRCPPLALLYRGSPTACGATAYDRGSLAHRTKLLSSLNVSDCRGISCESR